MSSDTKHFIEEKIEYLKTLLDGEEIPQDEIENSLKNCAGAINEHLARSAKLGCKEATEIITIIRQSPFTSQQRTTINKVVHMKVNEDTDTTGAKAKQNMQSCLYLHRYLDTPDSQFIGNLSNAFNARIDYLARFLVCRLGCSNPNEVTVAHAAAMLISSGCTNPEDALQISSEDAFAILRDMKAAIKAARSSSRMPHWGSVLVYPPSCKELEAHYPDVFSACYPSGLIHTIFQHRNYTGPTGKVFGGSMKS